MQIHVLIDGKQHGPYSPDEVRQYLSNGKLHPRMQARCEGMTDWQPLESFPEFAAPGAQAGRSGGRSRARLYAALAAGAVALCAVAGWLLWHGKPANGPEAKIGASPAAGTSNAVASRAGWPKTLAELNQWYAEPPAGQNAAEVFTRGCEAMLETVRKYSNNTNLPFVGAASTPGPGSPLPAAMKTAIAEFMQQTKPAWDLFLQGSSLAQSRYPMDLAKPEGPVLSHFAAVKQAALVSAVFALGYADTQRGKEAGDSLLTAYAIGRSLDAEPLWISQLVRMSCNALSMRSLERTVNRVAIPPQSLLQLQAVLGRMADREAGGESADRALVGEKITGLAYFDMSPEKLQKTFASFGTNNPSDTNGLIARLQKNTLNNVKDDRQFFVASWDQVFAAREQPFPSRLKADDVFGRRAAEARTQQFLLTTLMLPALGKTTLREGEALAQLRLAQTAVALERFRAAGAGRYPDKLAELSPRFLASVPEDPFDGQPLRYAKSGNGYTLHSIGPPGASEVGLKSVTFTVLNPPKPAAAAP